MDDSKNIHSKKEVYEALKFYHKIQKFTSIAFSLFGITAFSIGFNILTNSNNEYSLALVLIFGGFVATVIHATIFFVANEKYNMHVETLNSDLHTYVSDQLSEIKNFTINYKTYSIASVLLTAFLGISCFLGDLEIFLHNIFLGSFIHITILSVYFGIQISILRIFKNKLIQSNI